MPAAPEPVVSLALAQASDAGSLADLRVEAMRESLERVGRFDPERARQRLLGSFSVEHTRHVVVAGERVGFVVVRPDGEGLQLAHLYVRPGHQGQGIGGAVLQIVFTEADAAGLPLKVGALRESDANRFYLRHGFRLVEQAGFDNYYVRPPGK